MRTAPARARAQVPARAAECAHIADTGGNSTWSASALITILTTACSMPPLEVGASSRRRARSSGVSSPPSGSSRSGYRVRIVVRVRPPPAPPEAPEGGITVARISPASGSPPTVSRHAARAADCSSPSRGVASCAVITSLRVGTSREDRRWGIISHATVFPWLRCDAAVRARRGPQVPVLRPARGCAAAPPA